MEFSFEFTTATRIIFGRGSVKRVAQLVSDMGNNILLVTDKISDRTEGLKEVLTQAGFELSLFIVDSEPTTEVISRGVDFGRRNKCNIVVGIGGGSVIDSAKAIAALVPNSGPVMDYLEVIGKGKKLKAGPLPYIAVPTTSGTGAEVTKNAVIKSPEHRVKVSLRSPLMFPNVALVDPELAISMPPNITASTGMDALTHLLETFISNKSNPFIDNICREGMKRISSSLKRVFDDGKDLEARENMAYASMLGGMALANVKLGAVHGFAGPMGGMFPVPHGVVCASLLPAVLQINIRITSEKNQENYLSKYDEVARILTGNPRAKAKELVIWTKEMAEYLGIPSISEFGVSSSDFPELVQKAKKASSMKGNPVVLSDENLMKILELSF